MSHYDTLEVSPKASVEVIRAAYKSLMQRNHPDKNADAAAATARSAAIAQAYEVLSDPQRRQTYDETHIPPPAAPAQPLRRRVQPAPPAWRTWYPALLIVSILGAGATLLVLSHRQAPAPSAAPAPKVALNPIVPALATDAAPNLPVAPTPAAVVELPARILAAYLSDVRVELIPTDAAPSGNAHVLQIPDLGFRLVSSDPERWVHKLQAQRPQVIEQLLAALAHTPYGELLGTEGDLSLKKRIEETVSAAIGLEPPTASLQALLPLSFSIR